MSAQVSNWFINARVRLWKPMVEEMYKEEAGDAEMDSNSSSEIAGKATKHDMKTSEDKMEDFQQSATSTAMDRDSIHDTEMVGINADVNFQNGTRIETENDYRVAKSTGHDGLFPDSIVQTNGGNERFMAAAYHMSELGRFGPGNGVSLTLGLQHCEGGTLPLSVGTHQSFLTMRGDNIYNTAPSSVGPETEDFDCMDSGNRQHRFSSSHLLHDFVA